MSFFFNVTIILEQAECYQYHSLLAYEFKTKPEMS